MLQRNESKLIQSTMRMLDTTKEIQDKQLEIMLSKTPEERIKMGFDMINFAFKTVKNSILKSDPEISKRALSIEIFKRFYADCFSEERLNDIISKWPEDC
jgi:hypothetical protein